MERSRKTRRTTPVYAVPKTPSPRRTGDRRFLWIAGSIAVFWVTAGGIATWACNAAHQGTPPSIIAEREVGKLADFVEEYRVYLGELPPNLFALVWPPDGVARFASEIPLDPWGNEYRYVAGQHTFVLCSVGPDGRPSRDDICVDS